ncbi:hypothetical protein GCM10023210_04540 [Chryseobacterium ginsengisoli]|uniref:HNH endonuclease 5 domain-containing protein n=1 Tax=Chryseobacterium ginsengisoli TaxID=363853 RepID=A0ABP9LSI5_9FLAO
MIFKYEVEFLFLKNSIIFTISTSTEESMNVFLDDLFLTFSTLNPDNEIYTIQGVQIYNQDLENKFYSLVQKYKHQLPELSGVLAQLRKLNKGERFIFLPKQKMETEQRIKLRSFLEAENNGGNFEAIYEDAMSKLGDVIMTYNMQTFGDYRVNIGTQNKNHRICRFCKNKSEPLTFNNKAHAISEALGNKTLILYDECDLCNKRIGQTIESDIIEYLSLFRTMFSIKGKGGNKKFTGKNFELAADENNLKLTFKSIKDRPKTPDEDYNVKLVSQKPVVLQNIYKSLCKYFLSVIDENLLKHFDKTIDWINGDFETLSLPLIAEQITYNQFTTQPNLVYYIRKNDNKNLPYAVCEFQFTCKRMLFIIPFSDLDEKDFTLNNDFQNFWLTFKPYSNVGNWGHNDFSNNNAREFKLTLQFTKENKN